MKNVLVVDDSATILMLLSSEFKKYDFIRPFYAKTYKEATDIIRENSANFQAAILDLDLPDAPNGEIVGLANIHHIPAVVLTGSFDEDLQKSILKKDVIDFVIKDDASSIQFAVSALIRTLKNYDTTVLVVDDSSLYRTVISDILKTINLKILEAQDGEMALEMLKKSNDISLVITDYEMPKIDGMELVLKLREVYKKDVLGIIAISSANSEDITYKFLKLGANDFIHKPFSHNEIVTRVNSNLELLDLFSQIKDMANKDFLTGSYNRRYFFETASAICAKTKRKKNRLAVAMIDIDNFKNINDTYGHHIGDIAIKEVKKITDENLRVSDLMARVGGEEFCILLEDISLKDTKILFENIRLAFEQNIIKIDEITISYTVSIGIFYGCADSLEEMVNISDKALYIAKNGGRNRVEIIES